MGSEAVVWRETVHALWRWRIVIAVVALIGLLGGWLFAAVQKPRWSATSQGVVTDVVAPALLASLQTPSSSSKSGLLALDLPAETQARAMASPALLKSVLTALREPADDKAVSDFVTATRVEPVSDNAYTVTTDGPSARAAIDRANAIVTVYINQRSQAAKTMLNSMSKQADLNADGAIKQSNNLQTAIDNAASAGQIAIVTSLTEKQVSLQTEARADANRAAQLRNAANQVGTGSQLISPATDSTTDKSPKTLRDMAFGVIVGLLLAVVAILAFHHLSPRVGTRDDVAGAAGVPVLATTNRVGVRDQESDPDLRGLGIGVLAAVAGQRPEWKRLLILGVSDEAPVVRLSKAIAAASAEQGRATVFVESVGAPDPADPGLLDRIKNAFTAGTTNDRSVQVTRNTRVAAPANSLNPSHMAPAHQAAGETEHVRSRTGAAVGRRAAGSSNAMSAGAAIRVGGAGDSAGGHQDNGHPSPPDAARRIDPSIRPADVPPGSGVAELVAIPAPQRPATARKLLQRVTGIGHDLNALPAGRADVTAAQAAAALVPVLGAFDDRVVVAGARDDSAVGLLAGNCDAVVLLVRCGLDNATSISRTAQRVELAGADLLGVAVVGTSDHDDSIGLPAVQAIAVPYAAEHV